MSEVKIQYDGGGGVNYAVHLGAWASRSGDWVFIHRKEPGDPIVFACKVSSLYSLEFHE